MPLDLPVASLAKLRLLAAEDGVPEEVLVARLLDAEDRRRHIDTPPFEGEVRMRCFSSRCFETRPRRSALNVEEL